jgi:hypothetical protein
MRRIPIIACLLATGLVACDPGREEPPPDVKDTIFDEQVRALDKARAVEDVQDEHMKKLREAEEKNQGN